MTRAHPTVEAGDASGFAVLPVPPTGLVGRQSELAEVRRLLGAHPTAHADWARRVGQNRLALEVARANADDYPDGVALVLLAPLVDQDLVAVSHRSGAGRAGAYRRAVVQGSGRASRWTSAPPVA